MKASASSLQVQQAFTLIYLSPSEVFSKLKESRHLSWLVFLAIFAMCMLSNLVFFGAIDPEWVVNKQLAAAGDLSPSEREEMARIFRNFAEYSGVSGGIISMVMTLLGSVMLAAYYMIAANSADRKIEFNDWFLFTLFTQLPIVVKYLGFLVLFFLTPAYELELDLINYSSLNQLLLTLNSSEPLYQWAEYLDVFYLWQIALAAVGLKVWCQFSYSKSILLAAIPYLSIFIIWLLLI
ncbi:YIP1 family protein [Pseudoalteromonas aurantia]|uniref:Yip1 domain-containing protein n=1 Tax=Pseudoalteromonas aurantia TaxID=43654 RepID=A0A5S3V6U4_9GAMM|nr:YIP1 family protein [Pseudoalteromonas aurantia]TMO67013.1 hypothetical protein CWC18_02210 [Pseudoalteromonas aurantia]TMO67380.1 hypothetical protein CWC19_14330 [Pseudoalteromonas aurantia]TMO74721.1 hypothetical protein CWC20_09350 [Pseudoalteromonas aurantia]